MDGLTGTVPLGEPEEEIHQYSLFEIFGNEENKPEDKKSPRWAGGWKPIYKAVIYLDYCFFIILVTVTKS